MTSETRFIKVGPLSQTNSHYRSYKSFDLKGHKEISQIFVSGDEDGIKSLQFQYVVNAKYVLSDQYGVCTNISNFNTIELNHPAEYITGVNGIYTSDNIKVITFTTNIKKYGPFGITDANLQSKFCSPKSFTYNLGKSFQFGGFHGTYGSYGVTSIGFYLCAKTTLLLNSGLNVPKQET
ncbi:unnamed protein product [Cochlearia groenlandica]